MPVRIFTFFLFMTLLFPAGLWGAVTHRCDMEKSSNLMACCQGMSHENVPAGSQLTHHCSKDAAPSAPLVATQNHKIQIDAAPLVDAGIPSTHCLRLTAQILKASFTRVAFEPPGEGVPVFLRTCSFLI